MSVQISPVSGSGAHPLDPSEYLSGAPAATSPAGLGVSLPQDQYIGPI